MDWATRQAVEQLEYEARNSIVNNSTAGAILIVLNALERAEEHLCPDMQDDESARREMEY